MRPHISRVIVFALLTLAPASAAEPDFLRKEIAAYPFVASPERAAAIRSGLPRVTVGMLPSEVKSVLGEPDEVRDLYEAQIWNAKAIGHTYWYVIRRLVREGSAKEKRESLVRVTFDLRGRVSRVDNWGLEDAS